MNINDATTILDLFADNKMPKDELSLAMVASARTFLENYVNSH